MPGVKNLVFSAFQAAIVTVNRHFGRRPIEKKSVRFNAATKSEQLQNVQINRHDTKCMFTVSIGMTTSSFKMLCFVHWTWKKLANLHFNPIKLFGDHGQT